MHYIHIQFFVYWLMFEVMALAFSSIGTIHELDFIPKWIIFNALGFIFLILWRSGYQLAW